MSLPPAPEPADQQARYAELSMRWHGWGSPVGLGLFLLALGGVAVLVRTAIWGL
jgi:hypothetical protein